MSKDVEIVTLFRGKDQATYLLDDFVKHGENATPIRVIQNPSDATPWVEMKLQDVDAFYKGTENYDFLETESTDSKWNLAALKQLSTGLTEENKDNG